MGEEILSSGQHYSFKLLDKWLEVVQLGEIFREGYLNSRYDAKVANAYVAKLTSLLSLVRVKLEKKAEVNDLLERARAYEVYVMDPKQVYPSQEGTTDEKNGKAGILFEMQGFIGEVLERLKITKYEDGRY